MSCQSIETISVFVRAEKRIITAQSMAGYDLMRSIEYGKDSEDVGQGSAKRRLVAIHFLIQSRETGHGAARLSDPRRRLRTKLIRMSLCKWQKNGSWLLLSHGNRTRADRG